MRLRKFISLALAVILAIGIGSYPALANSGVGYEIQGSESGGGFVLTVSLHGARALAGRLAIAFDASKLELADTSSFANAVTKASGVTITPEGLDDSVLMSNEKGYVMFAWYSNSNSGIDAASSDKEIATIRFNLINGATTDDFSRNTIGLYYVNETMVDKWSSSAQVVTDNLDLYKNNALTDDRVCDISYDYPNCDYVPIIIYKTIVRAVDTNGAPLKGAAVTLDSLTATTNSAGDAEFEMESGVYAYRVALDGYETRTGYVIVRDADTAISVTARSFEELVQNTADTLAIGYADGDSATNVTAGVTLRTEGENGETITWRSSDSSVMSASGAVTRPEDDTSVTLTATVALGGAHVSKSFDIVVKSRLSAYEKSKAIVEQDASQLEIGFAPGDSADSVTSALTLAQTGAMGSVIVWQSSDENVIDEYGEVTRPSNDTLVTLTAIIMRGEAQTEKEFTVTVTAAEKSVDNTDRETARRVADAIEIGYADGDSAESVTQPLTLPTEGADGTVIEWQSSAPNIVTSYGGVVRQAEDAYVTLIATAVKGSATADKSFNLLVKAAETTPVNPDNGQESDLTDTTTEITPTPTTSPDATASPSATATPGTSDSTDGTGSTGSTGGTGSSGGSGGSGSSNTGQTGSTNAPTSTNAPENERFTDIGSVEWAREAILYLAENGVITGTSDTTYSPQDNIRRADFVLLLTRLYGLEGEAADSFDDVPADAYYYEGVSIAKTLGIISGIGDNKFNPEGSISRQDMMVMAYRALKELGYAPKTAADLSRFADNADIADYARESVGYLVGAGYINGDDNGKINPRSATTRAETAVFLYNIVK